MASILDNISNENPFREAFLQSLQTKTITKGTVLQHQNPKYPRGYFVKKGCLRSYTIDAKGKEHIFMFAPEDWIISDIEAQVQKNCSQLFIDAIENSEVEEFDTLLLNKMGAAEASSRYALNEKLFKRIAVLQKRIILLMSASAAERYQDFLETYPNIVNRVPQRMIASYLGITPEALSKIRGEQARKRVNTPK